MANPLAQPRTPTRFPKGVGTRKRPDPLYNFGHPDRTDYHLFHDDFDTFTAAQWTNTVTGTGTSALATGDGGLLAIATTGANNDAVYMQKTTEGFSFEQGRPAWFKVRLRVDALTCVVNLGLQITTTTPATATDGIYFLSTTGTGAVTTLSRKDTTTGSTSGTGIVLVANAFTDLAWYWDGKSEVQYYQDGAQKGTLAGVTATTFLPDTTTTVSMGITTTTAAVRTLTVDYIFAAKARR
jgi:hypothetical protein